MSFTRLSALGPLASLALAGCYGAAPRKLTPVPVPQASDAQLSVYSEETTHIETTDTTDSICASAGIPLVGASACLSADYSIDTPVTVVSSTAKLGDIPLSYGQFLVLSDPDYKQSALALDAHRDACDASAVPKWVGIGLAVGGLVALSAAKSDVGEALGWVGLGAGAATYTAGYVAWGGSRCEEGRRLYNQLDHSRFADTMVVTGANTAREMQAVASEFNARVQKTTVTQNAR